LTLPPEPPRPRFEGQVSEEAAFHQHVVDVADSLRKMGYREEEIAESLRKMCTASSLVESVSVAPQWVTWRFRSGGRAGIQLVSDRPFGWKAIAQKQVLERLSQRLNTGEDLFICG